MNFATRALDVALDKSIVLGYSRIGLHVRRPFWPAGPAPGALRGQHVVVTGASGGLGHAAAGGLAEFGATVHLVGRSQSRLDEAAGSLQHQVPRAEFVTAVCDVGDFDAVDRYAAELSSSLDSLAGIVHNAGVMPPERSESPQGHELSLATHVLGPARLTEHLRPLLAASGDGRVVVVSSGGMYSAPLNSSILDDLQYTRGDYSGVRAYARSKRLQVVLAAGLAQRYADEPIVAHSMHPGWAATPGVTESLPRFAKVTKPLLRSADEGAGTMVWLVASDEAARHTGLFWCDRIARPTSYAPWMRENPANWRRAWDAICQLAEVDDIPR